MTTDWLNGFVAGLALAVPFALILDRCIHAAVHTLYAVTGHDRPSG